MSNKKNQNQSQKKVASLDNETIRSTYDPEPFFALFDMYFERSSQVLIKHHIDSYNQFIEEIIPSILKGSENIISEKISENNVIRYRLTFEDGGIRLPKLDNEDTTMYPRDAVQKKLSYSAFYMTTVTQWQDIIDINTDKKVSRIISTEKDVPIAKIPIMVRSSYCSEVLKPDPNQVPAEHAIGGYFIVNGSEKIVLSVISTIDRKPMVFAKKDQNTFTYYVQVRSRPITQFVGNVQTFSIKIKKDNSIVLDYKQFKEIPVVILMRALGLETDEDIFDSIVDIKKDVAMFNFLNIVFNVPVGSTHLSTMTKEDAITYLMNNMRSTKFYSDVDPEIRAQQKRAHLMKILSQFILPHVTSGTNNPEIDMIYKAYYIGYMVYKLVKCYLRDNKDIDETRGCDDRDSLCNERIELPGLLLASLFEQFFKKMLNECNKVFRSKSVDDKNPPNIISHIKPNPIEQGLRQALSMGIFGSQSRKGLSQMFSRLNYLHAASYLRRVLKLTVDPATNKLTGPRHLHPTQFDIFCPLESPEGPKTGFVTNMAIISNCTIAVNSQIPIIRGMIEDYIISLESVNKKKLHRYVKVFINNCWIGVTDDIITIHDMLKKKRSHGEIENTVSLCMRYTEKEFVIYTEGGREYRPYLTVDPKTNKLNFKPEMISQVKTWDEFMSKFPGVIEYIDVEEGMNMMLASFPQDIDANRTIMNKAPIKSFEEIDKINRTNRYDGNVFVRYTHCSIHPCTMLGSITSNIPFCNHNAGVRGIYGFSQQKQAMGLPMADWRHRTDITYILYHTQVPLVATRAARCTGANTFPAGENCMVAIMSYMGLNQEDSLILNGSAVEKGLFRAQSMKKYQEEIKKNPALPQTGAFMKPDRSKVDNLKDANYDKLGPRGFAPVETYIKDGDAIIGMVNPKVSAKDDDKPYTDNSTIYRSVVPGAIDKVFTEISGDGYPIIKMRVRSERIPNIGDKFSCYDDQTEVLTNHGWMKFENLDKKKHMVATLVDGKELVYEYPSAVQSYHFNGPMYSLKSNQIDLCVTLNHRMWVAPRNSKSQTIKEYKLEEAQDIIGKIRFYQKNVDVFKGSSCPDTNDMPFYVDDDCFIANGYFILPELDGADKLRIDMKSWLIFFGIWLAEGFVKDKWTVSISAHKQRVKDALIKISDKYNLTIRPQKTYDGLNNQWNVCNKQLSKYIEPYSVGAINKYLPEWVWFLDKKNARYLIHGMMLGDGHIMKNGTRRYDTSSIKLANDFQRLCLHAGWATNIALKNKAGYTTKIRGRKVICNADAWRLTILEKQTKPKVNKKPPNTKKTNNTNNPPTTKKNKNTGSKSNKKNNSKTNKKNNKSNKKGTKKTNKKNNKKTTKKNDNKIIEEGDGEEKDTEEKEKDTGKKFTHDEIVSYVGKIYCCTVSSGVIYIRRNCVPVFCGNSLMGQKGTCGYKPHRSNLPYTSKGYVPDVIMNPTAIAKRMTIGQLIESFLGKVCAIKGISGDGTPFMGIDLDTINKELVDNGFEDWGNDTMYNGMTGKKMETRIFFGPTYYQRLKQMVGDKVHSRAKGPIQLLTHQPSEGRSRDGGLRVGEMERDALGAHGIMQFLKERLVDNSDIYAMHVCDICGLDAHKVPRKKHYICKGCQNTTKISKIICPYAFKLFMQELRSMNVLGRIRTSKSI